MIALWSALAFSVCEGVEADPLAAAERGKLGTNLVNLSAAVDIYFSTLPAAPTDDDATILKNATSPDPTLLAPVFKRYLLKTQYQQPYAVLLVCSKDGKRALMEDAGCSARLDRQVRSPAPCEFTLRVENGCRVTGGDPE
ncbi:hypothetical protein MoryE10_13290 [Methylogaea oryzae]|uniref:Uncharacterized protein n=2 Tax=Methylogaea oryzae TaxID=1295382 RepID=A0A8D5AGT4_9GAMM|nr:hypothetical protein MoryE10_13290 [Methylogaea oryzae]